MKNIAVLGSTGSIGTQTLDVVRGHRELFHISVLAANSSDELLEQQIREFEPELAVLSDEAAYARLRSTSAFWKANAASRPHRYTALRL